MPDLPLRIALRILRPAAAARWRTRTIRIWPHLLHGDELRAAIRHGAGFQSRAQRFAGRVRDVLRALQLRPDRHILPAERHRPALDSVGCALPLESADRARVSQRAGGPRALLAGGFDDPFEGLPEPLHAPGGRGDRATAISSDWYISAGWITSRALHLTTVRDLNIGAASTTVAYEIDDANGKPVGTYVTSPTG